MTKPDIQVFDTVEDLQNAAAQQIAALLPGTSNDRPFRIALSGGSTPRRLYELLRETPDIGWSLVHVYWGDERAVEPDHEECNYRMASEVLLDSVPIPESQIHRIKGELSPQEAAREYERTLRETFGIASNELPRFDLILLGMGADGHTASLFPDTNTLYERDRLVVANEDPRLGIQRITLTLPVLNAAREIMFLVNGQDKAPALRRVLTDHDEQRPPAALVRPSNGTVRWLLDREAAQGLK